MAIPIDHGAVVDGIRRLPTEYLECRTIGHSWGIEYMGPVGLSKDDDLIARAGAHDHRPDGVRLLHCIRCGMERIDLCIVGYGATSYSYRLIGRQYRYPDDYRLNGTRALRDVVQETLFDRYKNGRRTKGRK